MQTQISCPVCRTQFVGEVTRIIDIGLEPHLKERLLDGVLNVVQCPTCNSLTQVTTPILYHDPDNELFMVYVPLEMGLSYDDEQKLIGQLMRQSMDQLPAEQRHGYMLQPETIISLQTLVEKVLETEGITPEMLDEQRKKAELLTMLLEGDKVKKEQIIKERQAEIDETFFAMLRTLLGAAESRDQQEEYLELLNLQAQLFRETQYGRQLEKQQQALHAFSREVNQKEGLTSDLLLKHVIANRAELRTVEALVMNGQPAFNYDFFLKLSAKIEKRQKSGIKTDELIALRDYLVEFQQTLERRSREVLDTAQNALNEIISAEDKAEAVRLNQNKIDDVFMYVLSANLADAEQRGDNTRIEMLQAVQNEIVSEMARQAPPEVRLINQLIQGNDDAQRRTILAENTELVGPELLEVVKALEEQALERNESDLSSRFAAVQSVIARYLITQ